MPVQYAPSPEEMAKAAYPAKALKRNITQMRKAFAGWKTAKSNAQLESLLIEIVESVDSMYVLLKKHHPAEFQ